VVGAEAIDYNMGVGAVVVVGVDEDFALVVAQSVGAHGGSADIVGPPLLIETEIFQGDQSFAAHLIIFFALEQGNEWSHGVLF